MTDLFSSPAVLSFSMWWYVIYIILLAIKIDWSDNLEFDNLWTLSKEHADHLDRILMAKSQVLAKVERMRSLNFN